MNARHTHRHHDDEYADEIHITTVPRWKTSELSGDEWRTSARVDFRRKGQLIWFIVLRNLEVATAALPWFFRTFMEGPDGDPSKALLPDERTLYRIAPPTDERLCFQPGCSLPAVVEYELKKQFSRQEGAEVPSSLTMYRRFCETHAKRGDCGLEDADTNYTKTEWVPQ